jgi:MFS family permease
MAQAATIVPVRKGLVLAACILGSSMAFLDSTVVSVALPAIETDLQAGLATQQWVVEAYLLTLGPLMLVGGSLADLFGRRRVFSVGVACRRPSGRGSPPRSMPPRWTPSVRRPPWPESSC